MGQRRELADLTFQKNVPNAQEWLQLFQPAGSDLQLCDAKRDFHRAPSLLSPRGLTAGPMPRPGAASRTFAWLPRSSRGMTGGGLVDLSQSASSLSDLG